MGSEFIVRLPIFTIQPVVPDPLVKPVDYANLTKLLAGALTPMAGLSASDRA